MRVFSRIPCWFLLPTFLLACADGSNNNKVIPVPTPEPPASIFSQTTVDIPSKATPAFTPGTPGVVVENDKLLRQFGSAGINLNKARYTRYFLSDKDGTQPDAIIVLVPGFAAGAATFNLLAENLLRRAVKEGNLVLEVWAFDRRSNQLEDRVGLDIAEDLQDPMVGLDFLFGDALGLELSQALADGPNRRVIFYNSNEDTAFMAQWTPLVHSQDIDAVVEAARSAARSGNVFLGGHSAGTGFAARYAATDFNLAGGEPDPGYRKLRGLILLEGGGASQLSAPPDEATLDMIETRFDGGLYGAVRDQIPRCIDGLTACTAETAAADCQAFANASCQPVRAFTELSFLSTELFAAAEVTALDASLNDDSILALLQRDINDIPGNSAIEKVPELNILTFLVGDTPASSITLLGKFLDDDGPAAAVASFLATSLGFEGPVVNGVRTWLSKGESLPAEALADNGPAPQTPANSRSTWGQEVEPTDLEGRMLPLFYRGATNFIDWYYPSSGLGVTAGLGLDTTPLSAPPPLGRGRSDIDNRTQGAAIDIPVIGFGGSNGLAPVPAAFLGFADAIAPCSAPGCDGTTPRVLDRANPNEAFPTFGGTSGGYEVYISEGYAHVDIVTADDDEGNLVISRLLDFVERNLQ
ncbi:MAG: alpha/beta fold hydrolase [Halioglobus sp.]|nr:alpha/beta fold hydrolase [Halioglobus sp.]